MRKKIIRVVVVLILFIIVYNYSLLKYALTMGYHQMRIISEAKPLSELMNDSAVHDSIKQRLIFIQKVRVFAINQLSLQNSDNYTELFDQKGKAILFNLSASKKYKLEAKIWSFPIVGSFPYKGFFDLDEAKKLANELKDEWDVRVRSVGAWSTLGWFKDPILSNMLYRDDGDLAEVIIHELTHSTLFIKDSVELNENLASFIGSQGSKRFLLSELKDTVAYNRYIHSDYDNRLFLNHMLKGAKQLDSLYKRQDFVEKVDSLKKKEKIAFINQIISELDELPFKEPERYRINFTPNNAYFMSYKRYHEKENQFEKIFREENQSDIFRFISLMKTKYKKD
jgi:predicted aminopeptidase